MTVAVLVKIVAATPPTFTLVAPVKFVPVIVMVVPPATGPEIGVTVVMVGSATYVNAAVLVATPPAVVTTTSFAPAVPAGVTAVMEVELTTTTLVAATPPTFTVAPVKLVPTIVIDVPAVSGPDVGDTLAMENGALIRNGQREVEPYVTHSDPGGDPAGEDFGWQRGFLVRRVGASPSYHPSRNNWGPIVVPPRQYFMLGDNRDNSLDSRYWGFVADTLVRGRPLVVYYSYAPDSTYAFDWLTRVRWQRFGERVR